MKTRINKGSSLIGFPDDFIVLDLETTGLDPYYSEIIEIAAIKIRNGVAVETFETLIKPHQDIDEFITILTGISNEMVSNAPYLTDVLPQILAFISNDIIVGHNINFDINFLYDNLERFLKKPLSNDFIDTMRLSRKALPYLPHHRLIDIAEYFAVFPNGYHRALNDCQTTYECFLKIKEYVSEHIGIDEFIKSFKTKKRTLNSLTFENLSYDETNPFYQKTCVFTGKLDKMERAAAAQLIVNMGGKCEDGVTKNTNFLILGNNEYCRTIKDGKSNKQKKAEEYKLKGLDIEIVSENIFYDMLERSTLNEEDTSKNAAPPKKVKKKNPHNEKTEQWVKVCDEIKKYIAVLSEQEEIPAEHIKLNTNKDHSVSIFIESTMIAKLLPNPNIRIAFPAASILNYDPSLTFGIEKTPSGYGSFEINPVDVENFSMKILRDVFQKYMPSYSFGCCSRYKECSDAKKCIHPDLYYARGCHYRKNLKAGKIFY